MFFSACGVVLRRPSPPPLCRSDLNNAIIDGADFTNALLDKPQQMVREARAGWRQ